MNRMLIKENESPQVELKTSSPIPLT